MGSGIYKLYNGGKLVYIGKSTNIGRRVKQHRSDSAFLFDYVISYEIAVEDLEVVETALIKKYKPVYNYKENRKARGEITEERIKRGEKYVLFKCQNCKEEFKAFSLRAKYCSDGCRIMFFKRKFEIARGKTG